MTTQRIWRRVEAPGTYRGHALVADLHGVRWYAWEMHDGTWRATRGEDGGRVSPWTSFPTWTDLRTTAERAPNPNAAWQPMGQLDQETMARVRQTLGALVRSAGLRGEGGLWITVAPGHGELALARLHAANFPFNVRIWEAP